MPRTPKQISASRTNGAKSRGPTTAEGRLKCSGTRLRHGRYAASIVLDGESRKRFLSLIESLYLEFQPQTACQEMLVEKMAVAQWRQMRLWTYEKTTITREAEKQRELTGLSTPLAVDAVAFQSLAATGLTQHEMRFDRQFTRSLNRLVQLQKKVGTQQVIETIEGREK
jgi:hypothetical protein